MQFAFLTQASIAGYAIEKRKTKCAQESAYNMKIILNMKY